MNMPIDEIWRGGVQPVPTGESGWRFDGAPELRAMIDRGRPLLLVGYAISSPRRAAEDLLRAADYLATCYGLDVRRDLPKPDEMVTLLANTPHVFGRKSIELRTVLIDLRSVGVVATLTVRSSGRPARVNSDGPVSHVAWLNHVMRSIEPRPAGLLTTRMDRITRSLDEVELLLSGMSDLAHAAGSVWAASEDGGRWPLPGARDLDGAQDPRLIWFVAHSHREMASRMRGYRAAAARRGRRP